MLPDPLSPSLSAPATANETPFQSFLMGGFESATHRNGAGLRIDMIASTQHDVQAAADYAMLRDIKIRTVRDGVRWHLIETLPGIYDFSSLSPLLNAALETGTQVIWSLMHYGVPDHVNMFSADFPEIFARFCHATAHYIRTQHIVAGRDAPTFYTPVNEISFMAPAVADGMMRSPFRPGGRAAMKRQLVQAALRGMDSIWDVDPRARFVHVDPVIHVMPPRQANGRILARHRKAAASYHDYQYQAWDMLCGRMHPELGGHDRYLDIIGINFYHNNQWEHPVGQSLNWANRPRDPRWKRFSDIAQEVHDRYGRPFILSETSHIGMGRSEWLQEITLDVLALRKRGLPIHGACLYPIIDRPDWDDPGHWHNSGLWDLELRANGMLKRVLVRDYAQQVRLSQFLFDDVPA